MERARADEKETAQLQATHSGKFMCKIIICNLKSRCYNTIPWEIKLYRSRKCCCSNLNICGQSYIVVVVRAKEEKYIHHHMNKVINIFNKHHVSISFTSASSNKMVDIWSPIGFYFQRIHSVQASIFSIRSRSNKAQNWLDCVPIVPHFTFHCIEIFLHDFRPDVSWSLINRRCFLMARIQINSPVERIIKCWICHLLFYKMGNYVLLIRCMKHT